MADILSGMQSIGIVGASARAAIHSLARAGQGGWAVDLFADRDLKLIATCKTCPVDQYPGAFPALIEGFPTGPVIYTGGLENHPEVLAQIAVSRPLWGNGPDVLRRVRNPLFLQKIGREIGPTPQLLSTQIAAPATGRWLRKPLRSSAGQGIRFAIAGEAPSPHHYFQQFIDGSSHSALFISSVDDNTLTRCRLLGFTEQLIGEDWLHAKPFTYCGNIGPLELPHSVVEALEHFGMTLSDVTKLRGLWGVDFILSGDAAYPLEVNPRYTAAIEVLELSLKLSCMTMHCDCFNKSAAIPQEVMPQFKGRVVGKAIYYAPHRMTFPQTGPWDRDLALPFDPWRVPGFADIPAPLSTIEAGSPVLTMFAEASSAALCRKELQSGAEELDRLFRESFS